MRRRLDGSSLSATVKTRKSTATRWKPCARWPRNRATPASVALSPESVRDDERQTAGASTQPLLQRMDRFEAHLAQLASRLHGREALLKSLQELLRQGMTEK